MSPVQPPTRRTDRCRSISLNTQEANRVTLGPTVIPEDAGNLIKFSRKKQLYIGYTWQGYVYKLIGCQPLSNQTQIVDASLRLEQHGHTVLVTASNTHYGVWVQL